MIYSLCVLYLDYYSIWNQLDWVNLVLGICWTKTNISVLHIWQEDSDSELESNHATSAPHNSQKHKRVKVQPSATKEDAFHSWSMATRGGCLSLLKGAQSDGSDPCYIVSTSWGALWFSPFCFGSCDKFEVLLNFII